MDIISFKNYNFRNLIKHKDIINYDRDIGYSLYKNVIITGRNNYYPNVLLFTDNKIICPYEEKTMSLNKETYYDNNQFTFKTELVEYSFLLNEPVFFFIYNFENYYHFIYDTLSYLYLLKKYNFCNKILVNYPNKNMSRFFDFNMDIITKLNLEIILVKENIMYENLIVSSSLTHGGFSNNKPYEGVYEFFNTYFKPSLLIPLKKRIYISRRTWINNNLSNIGTNYTTRRKMINEDLLVEELKKYNIEEVFTENLSLDEKINLFANAELVIGAIGGGMCNLLFSPKETKSIVIVTPYFLDINYRFKYSMDHTNITYFYDVNTYKQDNKIPLYCRVIYKETICEISNYKDGLYQIKLSNNDVVGFNIDDNYNKIWLNENEFELLDNGLNSPYIVNIEKLLTYIQ